MSASSLGALSRAPNAGPPMYTASAPWLTASMPMSASRAGASSSIVCVLISVGQPGRRSIQRCLQLGVRTCHRKLRELLRDRLGRMDEEPGVGSAQHAGVVVRVADRD